MKTDLEEIRISGKVISSGIAIGKPFFLTEVQDVFQESQINVGKVETEIVRFKSAVKLSLRDLRELAKQLTVEGFTEGASIIDVQLQLLDDPLLFDEVQKRIRSKKKNAEHILQNLLKEFQNRFEGMSDAFFRERFSDIQDITRRIMNHLRKSSKNTLPQLAYDSILFAEDLSPSETAEASQKCVRAIVSERGSATAHAAILARAKEIPYITHIPLSSIPRDTEGWVIVDGRKGELIINPSPETLTKYKQLKADIEARRQENALNEIREVATFDGYEIRLMANIETAEEISLVHQFGGNGVGLYRSENILVGRDSLPNEDEQFRIYRTLIEGMRGLPITIRTFDVGRDKANLNPHTRNTFLGFRAIANLKREKEIFNTQLQAILRASEYGEVNILFPMVSSLSEVLEAKQMVRDASRKIKSRKKVKIGCMIEVPSAAIIADLLAKESDFLSIGTNDLIQYTLAVDRCDHLLSHLYQPAHPCVLRLIQHVVNEASRQNVPVSVCGEMASDPKFTPLLIGLGIRELSVAARYIPLIKETVRSISIIDCCKLAEKALSLPSSQEIQHVVEELFKNNFARSSLDLLR